MRWKLEKGFALFIAAHLIYNLLVLGFHELTVLAFRAVIQAIHEHFPFLISEFPFL